MNTHLLFLALVLSLGILKTATSEEITTPTTSCCPRKIITGDGDSRSGTYTFNTTMDVSTLPAECKDGCIYTKMGLDELFCFAPGNLTSECVAIGPKRPDFTTIMIGGSSGTETIGYPCNTSIEDFPIRTSEISAVVFKDEILVCGSFSNLCYTEKASKWIQTPNMAISKLYFTMSSFKDSVIVTGGQVNENPTYATDEMEIFNGTTWTKLNKILTSPRYHHCAVVISDTEFYVLGGKNGDIILPIMEKYDNKGNLVDGKIQNMTTPRFDFGCAVMEGKIYAAGGQQMGDTTNTFEIYDPSLNTWNLMKAKFENGMMGFHLVVLNGNLTAIGHQVLSYDGENWTKIEEANKGANDYFALVVVPCSED
ncbi:influenza virus NS1A-binding protein homolog B [Eurytemora carolleeae]|uniref:influenza virus NS1A-binding protein homolog B n=1 Tax=Eurytemora carolleeae TaxID=1294199 RepID=UPI000C76C5BA|nr:influenza virus NS1A-binding protein homolog B [Eurytemora carolleeae]|eukprot:XP_023346172.1 influenza virus NS1A-binding protein homolog B-like [Eurytemora affinis]